MCIRDREEGMRYREIGVVATDLNGYGDYLEEAFAKYRIPVFMDYKRSILLNSFVEYVRSILNMAEQSFTYESVFRVLRAGYGPFTDDEVDEMCIRDRNPLYQRFMGVKYQIRQKKDGTPIVTENAGVAPVAYATDRVMAEEEYQTLAFPYNQTALMNYAVVNANSTDCLLYTSVYGAGRYGTCCD